MAGSLRAALAVLVMLAVPGSSSAGQPAPDDPRTALIVGQVVDAGSGRPVSGVFVQCSGGPVARPAPGSPPLPSRPRVMTDADGRFVFRALAAGAYSLTAIKPGYLDGAFGRRRPGGTGQTLPLAAGEKAGDVTIAIWRYGTISGSVFDEAGEPVVGLEIRALKRTLAGGRRRFTQSLSSIRETSTTDDRGQFRVSGLAPGDYAVVSVSQMASVPLSTLEAYRDAVQAGGSTSAALFHPIYEAGASSAMPGTAGAMAIGTSVLSLQRTVTPPPAQNGKIFVYPTTYYPAAVSAAQAGIVTIGSGEERSAVDFHLRPVPASRVTGTVTSADGAVGNLALTLTVMAASDTAADTDAVAGTVTDANGAFTSRRCRSGNTPCAA